MLYEKDSHGTERWFYSLGGQVVAQREHTGVGGDHLGSTSLATDGAGNIQQKYAPSPLLSPTPLLQGHLRLA